MPTEVALAPLPAYMLADHLDAALAAGEDLIAQGAVWLALAQNPPEPAEMAVQQREVAERVRAFELMLVARTLKAREHAEALAAADVSFRAMANLFVGGTGILLDAIAECGDARADDFETGDELVAYIRSRGLIAPDAPFALTASQLTIDDSFLVAKRIALGPLLDMAAAFLDALEVRYDLFPEQDDDGPGAPLTGDGTPRRPQPLVN